MTRGDAAKVLEATKAAFDDIVLLIKFFAVTDFFAVWATWNDWLDAQLS